MNSVADLKFAPFFLLATEGKLYFDRTHEWHMRALAELCGRDLPPQPPSLKGKGEKDTLRRIAHQTRRRRQNQSPPSLQGGGLGG